MPVNVGVKTEVYKNKFAELTERFNAVLDKAKETGDSIFKSTILNPSKALTEQEVKELDKFLNRLCKDKTAEVNGCDKRENTDNIVLLNEALSLVKEFGFFYGDELRGKKISSDQYKNHLVTLIEGAIQSITLKKSNLAAFEANALVRAYRNAAFSLDVEFAEFKESEEEQRFGSDKGVIRDAVDDIFKTETSLSKSWSGRSEGNEQAIALYGEDMPQIHAPELHENPKKDSQEALENLNKTAYYHFVSEIGAEQVLYLKSVALPILVDSVCKLTQNHSVGATKASRDAKYVMRNFEVIFKGLPSDYTEDIKLAYAELKDIRNPDVGIYNLSHFINGVNILAKLVKYIELQHPEWSESRMNDITELCPELSLETQVPLLAGSLSSSDANEENAEHYDL